MKFFKNFQTKRQLREEIKRLEFILHRPNPIRFVEREVQKISSCIELSKYEIEVPIEVIKKEILHRMVDELEPFVEWDIEDIPNQYSYQKQVKANIYLAKRK